MDRFKENRRNASTQNYFPTQPNRACSDGEDLSHDNIRFQGNNARLKVHMKVYHSVAQGSQISITIWKYMQYIREGQQLEYIRDRTTV